MNKAHDIKSELVWARFKFDSIRFDYYAMRFCKPVGAPTYLSTQNPCSRNRKKALASCRITASYCRALQSEPTSSTSQQASRLLVNTGWVCRTFLVLWRTCLSTVKATFWQISGIILKGLT